jgi:hypothetical protein
MTGSPAAFGPGVAPGRFVGDYMGPISIGRGVWPVFGVANAPNKTNFYTQRITLPTSP